ncbi:uncharacterized protein LOC121785370 [Salvia splendens]|uniref:uncharacterized protein LOC121785370 n=1 Tax=Salvia splendens TaxID=180675 RepID=UPI001C255FC3|nr:uncharacterized protein LOC121785370 [Salvia splendens]
MLSAALRFRFCSGYTFILNMHESVPNRSSLARLRHLLLCYHVNLMLKKLWLLFRRQKQRTKYTFNSSLGCRRFPAISIDFQRFLHKFRNHASICEFVLGW